ncbi:hypothetical protein FN846DRAFT_955055 [Sphaerosporella brunnea]|uniref:Uncharacterized protein n=1 Tax=Sphaerosporella brunnea TaxID=1250544 RepID=A0A5J5ETR2_9PEZI|nr:hypothetical protein FN846DRAFT_955055 [Sphaerosporella brunnea]
MRIRREGVIAIQSLETLCSKSDSNRNLHGTIYDTKRFILSNTALIASSPLQVYISALLYSPKKSEIRTRFLDQMPLWIKRGPQTRTSGTQYCKPLMVEMPKSLHWPFHQMARFSPLPPRMVSKCGI